LYDFCTLAVDNVLCGLLFELKRAKLTAQHYHSAYRNSHSTFKNPMTLPNHPPRRQSYMLRCTETRSSDPAMPSVWRFCLQDPVTGEQHGFADLESLLVYLRTELSGEIGQIRAAGGDPPPTRE
jgi:hypothetical protein